MARFVRLYVEDETEFTDELFAFVIDPNPTSRNARPVILELNDLAPEMVDVLESMVLDGVEERHYVADYVHALVTGEGLTDPPGGPAV
jgi:hypothetical protein